MIAAPIHATIDLATLAIELPVNPIAFAIKAVRQTIITGRIGAVRLAIQAIIYSITLLVEKILDAITTITCAIGLIGKYSSADDQQNA